MREILIVVGIIVGLAAMLTLGPMAPLLAIVLMVYFLPAIFARTRHKQNFGAILALNTLAGWTGIGWLVALIWAFRTTGANRGHPHARPADPS